MTPAQSRQLGFTRTAAPDAAYAVLVTDRTLGIGALTAARTYTLPAASAYPTGATLTVVDEGGACSATNTVTLAAAGSDTINGASSAVISTAYGYLALESNGAGKWTILDAPGGAVTASTKPVMDGTAAVGSSGQAARADHIHPSDTSRLAVANNLSDLANLATAITNLGLTGSLSTTSGSIRVPTTGGALFLIYGICSVSGDATVSMSNSFPNNNFGGVVQSLSTFSANQSGQPVFLANLDPNGFTKSSFVIRPYQSGGGSGTVSLGYTTKFFYVMLGN